MRNWTWLVLVASGGLAWACGGDDDGGSTSGNTGGTGGGSTTGSGGSGGGGTGGTSGSGGTGGSGGTTTGSSTTSGSGGTGGGAGGSGGGGGSTSTTSPGTGGSAGGAGDAGAAGAAGDNGGGTGGGGGDPTLDELCRADCEKQVAVGCDLQTDVETCITATCMYFYNPACDAEYKAFLECDAAAPVEEFVCYSGFPMAATSCSEVFYATFCE